MIMPLTKWKERKRTYTFGVKTHYNDFHVGIDIIVPTGTPIFAHTDVFVQKFIGTAGGRTIHVRDANNMLVRYLHLSKFAKLGYVKQGEIIGYTGGDPSDPQSGISTGPHVHIDVSKNNLNLNDLNNFIDPEVYFQPEPIKIKFVCVGEVDKIKLETYIRTIFDWYNDLSNYELQFQYDIEYLNNIETIVWKTTNYSRFSNYWAGQYLSARASGKDIVIGLINPSLWNTDLLGFHFTEQCLGVRVIGVKMDIEAQDARNRQFNGNNYFSASLRHEIMHALYSMQGSSTNLTQTHKNGTDNTHYFDYKAELEKAIPELNRDKMKGWEIDGYTRLFAYAPFLIKGKTKPDWIPKNGKIYYSQDNRMFFIYENGWRIIDEEKYREYKERDRAVGMISVKEANWIYDKLGQSPPPIDNGHVTERIVKDNKVPWYRVYGYKKDIPTNHLIY